VYRRAYLETHRLCRDPYRRHVGIVKLATDVDHIEAVEGEKDPLFWVEANHQPLCHACHSYKTALENGAFGRMPKDGGGQGDMGVENIPA
jgi:5-methylcytosine-specific restriction protein A